MKLCVHVLLLALGVSGQCHESNECDMGDITSQLHLANKTTKATEVTKTVAKERLGRGLYQINEYLRIVRGRSPIELRGPEGETSFQGCLWTIATDFRFPASLYTVGDVVPVSGAFDGNGLLEVSPGLDFRTHVSFAIFLTKGCPGFLQSVLDLNLSFWNEVIQEIYDSIWLPELHPRLDDFRNLYPGVDIPGTELGYPGWTPELVFRDGSTRLPYQVRFLGGSRFVIDVSGLEVDADRFQGNPTEPTFGQPNPILRPPTPPPSTDPTVMGDPHIHTMDGGQYTLLREGSFLLWRFGLPQPHVEWQIFAHYAGRQSFTKGLLLVDTSGSEPSSMEITSEHCEWQTQSSSKNWSSVNSEAPVVLLSNPSSRMKLVGNQHKEIQLFIADEKVPVATLKVMCRQGRHINMKLHMENRKWASFVSGELKGQKGQKHMPTAKTSMLQLVTSEDDDFEVKKTWAQLGGSSHAQQYLQDLDEHPNKLTFSQMCDPQAQADARALCQKHLGTVAHSSYLEECVYDVCAGGGEEVAEMTAEMLKF